MTPPFLVLVVRPTEPRVLSYFADSLAQARREARDAAAEPDALWALVLDAEDGHAVHRYVRVGGTVEER